MANRAETGSPEWWLRQLHYRIQVRRMNVRKLRNYYDGEHNLQFASDRFLMHFGGLFNAFSDNWCETVIDASVERQSLQGFRLSADDKPNMRAWDMWQQSDLDAMFEIANTSVHVDGETIATAWFDDNGKSLVTFDAADTAVVATDPRNPRRKIAGLRVYLDEWGFEHAELFLPGSVHFFRSRTQRAGGYSSVDAQRVMWDPDTLLSSAIVDGPSASIPNVLGVVPMVPMQNKPRLWVRAEDCAAQSELVPIIPLQDAVNKLISDLIITSEAGAFPLRYAAGYTPDVDPNGNPLPPPWMRADKQWAILRDPQAKIGNLEAADLSNWATAVELVVSHIASISRTPPHYLNTSADRLSGESIKSAETGLVAKVTRKMKYRSSNAEDLIRLCGAIENVPEISNATNMETIWSDPESRTESEHIDAVGKKRQVLEVPLEQVWEDAGYSPTAIERMRKMRLIELAEAMERSAELAQQQDTGLPVNPDQEADSNLAPV